ncbi:MAG: hypothetical protein M1827_003951 [Pycnora praestabilis]|nr:MAG: hypothetical protein M1827_003951 [Pycnora praestabilis]
MEDPETPSKRKRGRPKNLPQIKRAKTRGEETSDYGLNGASSAASGGNQGLNGWGSLMPSKTGVKGTPSQRTNGTRNGEQFSGTGVIAHGSSGESPQGSDNVAAGRSSGRQRRRPRRYSNDMMENAKKRSTGRSTLVKRTYGTPKRLLPLSNGEHEELGHQLGFKDIPVSKAKARVPTSSVQQVEGNEEAEEVNNADSSPESVSERPLSVPLENLESVSEEAEEEEEGDVCAIDSIPAEELTTGRNLENSNGDYSERFAHALNHATSGVQFRMLKNIVLEKLTGKRKMRLIGLDEEYSKVHQLLQQTVVAGEGNSMLVIGSRGSGKTTLVETIISDLSVDHKESFHVIRLNGFVHTDDKLALREIWRQLGREMEVEEDAMGKTSNYADTLSSLLALLSHPSEILESAPDESAKSVLFVMDEFDLFASHPRQTLLYNLFDIAQSRKAPIAVLGLTSRIDVTESLEKRVKSRFSHRYVHIAAPKTLPSFWSICKEGLTVDATELQLEHESNVKEGNEERVFGCIGGSKLIALWNLMIEDSLYGEPIFKLHVESIFYRTKSAKEFFAACLLPIAQMTLTSLPLKGQDFMQSTLPSPESKLHILEGLSDVELSLLIAAARLDIILDTDTCNFSMAYDEYQTLASRVKAQSSTSGAAALGAISKIWGRDVSLSAWEKLAEYELIVPAIGALSTTGGASGAGGGSGSRDIGRMGRMFRVDVGLEEILPSVPGMGSVMAKWCKEI